MTTQIIGNVPRFNGENSWSVFQQELMKFFIANAITDTKKQKTLLLTSLSEVAYIVLQNSVNPLKLEDEAISFDECMRVMDAHFKPASSAFAERDQFYRSSKLSKESINEWAARVRALAVSCEFGAFLQMAMRDKFVMGLEKCPAREKIFLENVSCSMSKAVEIANTAEYIRQQNDLSNIKQEQQDVGNNCYALQQRQQQSDHTFQQQELCSLCGLSGHSSNECSYAYNMNHKNRGLALIFNHTHFYSPSIESRDGAIVDCENLHEALKKLDFKVSVHKDCKVKEIFKHIKKVGQQDHSESDCIFVAILSHGELGYVHAKDFPYKLNSIWHYFTDRMCPTLTGKPKLFFIQACQGDGCDPGEQLGKTETDGESSMIYKISVHPDFLIAHSTIAGFKSFRNTINGSWFIQALVQELNTNGKKYDILTLLTFVNQRVAVDFESYVPDKPWIHQKKQIPCVTTMLTRILRFNDKDSESG